MVNAAFGAACLAKVVCVLFEPGSHPVIETGWVRWLAKCEGKKKVKIPKQYQGKTNNNNSNTNKRNNNKTLRFFLASAEGILFLVPSLFRLTAAVR